VRGEVDRPHAALAELLLYLVLLVERLTDQMRWVHRQTS
jgi:hypothetical protein